MKKGNWLTLLLVCLVFLLVTAVLRASDYNTKVHVDQGGDQLTVESGGKIVVESGGTIEVQSGATLSSVDEAAVDTDSTMTANSDTIVPSQKAVKTALATKSATSHTHLLTGVTDVTATETEVNYLVGVTSGVQSQINGKAATSHTQLATSITGVVEDIAIDTTLVAAQAGEIITNTGAGASKTFTLPTPAKGLIYTIVKVAAQNLKVVAGSGAILGTSNNSYVTTTAGSTLRLAGVSTTQWALIGYEGTWVDTTVLP